MKKISLKVATCLLAGCFLLSSCYVGKYALFNKYVKWQTNMTNNKFVNAIVGFIITPFVGSVCLFADVLVLNTIEFWDGTNPVASNNIGKTQQVMGQDGRYYAVTTLKNGYEVKAPTGEITNFIHNDENNSWSVVIAPRQSPGLSAMKWVRRFLLPCARFPGSAAEWDVFAKFAGLVPGWFSC